MWSKICKFLKSNRQKPKRTVFSKPRRLTESVESKKVSVENFTQESSIHGLRFLSKRQSGTYTRIFWTVSLIFSLIGLSYNTKRLYTKLHYEPDIGISESFEMAREIPFPAITICLPLFTKDGLANNSHYMQSFRINNKTNVLNLSESTKKILVANSMKCTLNRLGPLKDCCNDTQVPNILQMMHETTQTVDEALVSCAVEFTNLECKQVMTRTLTDRGFCYTTNMQDVNTIFNKNAWSADQKAFMETPKELRATKPWTLDGGYEDNVNEIVTPLRLNKMNLHSVRIQSTDADVKNSCKYQNILLKLHMPNEIATIFHNSFHLEHGSEKILLLNAKVTRAHKSLKGYSPHERECYFEGEKTLKFFRIYTKNHCQLECLADYVLRQCGCVAFYMPRNSSTKICGLHDAECWSRREVEWPLEGDHTGDTTPCNCYPTCNDIEYSAQEISSKYDASMHADLIKNYSTDLIYSRVYVNFRDHLITEHEKFVAYTLQNFIADFGGLMGLFLGCSLLSMIEIFYFLGTLLKDKYKKKNDRDDVGVSTDDDLFKELHKIGNDIYIVREPLYTREDKEDGLKF